VQFLQRGINGVKTEIEMGADHRHIIPFIKKAESYGGTAVPGDPGGITVWGITEKEWIAVFGENEHARFMLMSDEDFEYVFENLYWNKILGDQINSQIVPDFISDWVWNSGYYYPEIDIQELLVKVFAKQIQEDGIFGTNTINAINATDPADLINQIAQVRSDYYLTLDIDNPINQKFINGWEHRVLELYHYEIETGILKIAA
jgi:lysozyme family protein